MGERKGAGFRPNISYIVIQCLFSIFISLRQFFLLSTYFLRCNGHLGGLSLCPLLIKMHRLDAHVRSIHRRHLFSCLDQTRRVCLVWLTFSVSISRPVFHKCTQPTRGSAFPPRLFIRHVIRSAIRTRTSVFQLHTGHRGWWWWLIIPFGTDASLRPDYSLSRLFVSDIYIDLHR